jgi:hypothetical protein
LATASVSEQQSSSGHFHFHCRVWTGCTCGSSGLLSLLVLRASPDRPERALQQAQQQAKAVQMQQQKLARKCLRRDAASTSESSSSSSSVASSSSSPLDPLPEDALDDPREVLDGARAAAGGRSTERTEQRLCSDRDCDMYERPMAGAVARLPGNTISIGSLILGAVAVCAKIELYYIKLN